MAATGVAKNNSLVSCLSSIIANKIAVVPNFRNVATSLMFASPTITCRRLYFAGSQCGSSRVFIIGRFKVVSKPISSSKNRHVAKVEMPPTNWAYLQIRYLLSRHRKRSGESQSVALSNSPFHQTARRDSVNSSHGTHSCCLCRLSYFYKPQVRLRGATLFRLKHALTHDLFSGAIEQNRLGDESALRC